VVCKAILSILKGRESKLNFKKVYSDRTKTRSSATAEIARDGDDVDFSVDDVHSALTLVRPFQTDGIDEP